MVNVAVYTTHVAFRIHGLVEDVVELHSSVVTTDAVVTHRSQHPLTIQCDALDHVRHIV